jgi:hypothetical protein
MTSRRSVLAACLLAASGGAVAGGIPADLTLEPVITSGISAAVGLRHAGDGSGRLFVIEQTGAIRIFADGALNGTPFLVINNATPGGFSNGGERGLLGLAFHPDYASNRKLYVNYTDGSGDTRIVEYMASAGDPDVVDTASRREVMRIEQPAGNHNGGNILFGPDGYLYIGMGDGGSGNDPWGPVGNGQNLETLLGKMLRIDVDVTSSTNANACGGDDGELAYGIPDDNPFADGGGCAEIAQYGLRNPWRWSFDRSTGDLLIGDVGQGAREEIDFVAADDLNQMINFGWRCFEGTSVTGLSCPTPLAYPHTPPIIEYNRSGGNCAVTGGYRYRGPIAGLQGVYIFADYCNRQIRFATESGGNWTVENWSTPASGSITSFGEDEEGNIYVVRQGGVPISVFRSDEVVPETFTVTPTAGPGGSISPDTPQEVEEGETAVFTVTPDPDHVIAEVTGCGGSLAGNTYTTGPITGDCEVVATFEIKGDLIFDNGFELPD